MSKGMSDRDINKHIADVYGVGVYSEMVSKTIGKMIMPIAKECQCRALAELYPIPYLE